MKGGHPHPKPVCPRRLPTTALLLPQGSPWKRYLGGRRKRRRGGPGEEGEVSEHERGGVGPPGGCLVA